VSKARPGNRSGNKEGEARYPLETGLSEQVESSGSCYRSANVDRLPRIPDFASGGSPPKMAIASNDLALDDCRSPGRQSRNHRPGVL